MAVSRRRVFIAGGTGYMGSRLIPALLRRGHEVRALVRKGSERKLVSGCMAVAGDPLELASYAGRVAPSETFVHLVGVPHPSPRKAEQFRSVDLPALRNSVEAGVNAAVQQLVYVSVAHPAPMMRAYIEVRMACEEMIRASGLKATILRPWYVLGPGHRWPYALAPMYWLAERLPPTRAGARRLGLVTLAQMVNALVGAVENPAAGVRVLEVPQIRDWEKAFSPAMAPARA